MIIVAIFFSIFSFLISLFSLYAVWRLNKYISYTIEEDIEKTINRQDTVEQTIKMALGENLINPNNRLKRPLL